MNSLARIPLVLVLAFSATIELMLNRIGANLVNTPSARQGVLYSIVDFGGLFSFYWTGFLALGVFTWAVIVMIRDRSLLRIPDRVAFTVAAALFLPLASMGLIYKLPKLIAPQLNTTFGLLIVVLLFCFMRRPAQLRSRLGVIYLAAPILLHAYWLLTQQVPAVAPGGGLVELPIQLFRAAEHLVVVGAFAAFLFFSPPPRLSSLISPWPLSFAVMATVGVGVMTHFHYLVASQAAYYGLGINLPPLSAHGAMHMAALFFFVLTIGALALRSRREHATALGLYLVGISGFHLQLPYQLLLTLVGLIQVIRSTMDIDENAVAVAAPNSEQLAKYLAQLATACSDPDGSGESMMLQNNGQHIGHVRGVRNGMKYRLRLLFKTGGVDRLEVIIGDTAKDASAMSLLRRRGRRGGRVAGDGAGKKIKLGIPRLDRLFTVQDSTGTANSILGREELLDDMEQQVHGWLGLWPGEGLRYISRPAADGWPIPLAEVAFSGEAASTDTVEELIQLLTALARGARVVEPVTG